MATQSTADWNKQLQAMHQAAVQKNLAVDNPLVKQQMGSMPMRIPPTSKVAATGGGVAAPSKLETTKQTTRGGGASTVKTTAAGGAATNAQGSTAPALPTGTNQIAALTGKQYASGQNIVADGRMQSEVQFGAGEKEIPMAQAQQLGLINPSSGSTQPWKVTMDGNTLRIYQPHGVSSMTATPEMLAQMTSLGITPQQMNMPQSLESQGVYLSPNQPIPQQAQALIGGQTPQTIGAGDRKLGPTEFANLRKELGADPNTFSQYFKRDAQGNIYLKGDAAKGPTAGAVGAAGAAGADGAAGAAGASGTSGTTGGTTGGGTLSADRQAILDAMKMGPDEEAAQKQLSDIMQKEQAVVASKDLGIAAVENKPIAMKLLMGDERRLINTAKTQLEALGISEKGVKDQLAIMQAKRKSALDSAKMMYDFEKEDVAAQKAAASEKLATERFEEQMAHNRTLERQAEERIAQQDRRIADAEAKAARRGSGGGKKGLSAQANADLSALGTYLTQKFRGSDGYVDTAKYKAAYEDFALNYPAQAKNFLTVLPPSVYLNPQDPTAAAIFGIKPITSPE